MFAPARGHRPHVAVDGVVAARGRRRRCPVARALQAVAAATAAAAAASASAALNQHPHGKPGCRCLNSTSWRAAFATAGNTSLQVNVAGVLISYPFSHGLSNCSTWDEGLPPSCADPITAPSWCREAWCWVDASSCSEADVKPSKYFHNVGAAFSYSTCSSSDTFSSWYDSQSCNQITSDFNCSHLKATRMWTGAGGWSDQLGATHTCGSSPRPCQSASTFLEAVQVCNVAGGRLCSEAELLNDEVAATGCGFDSAQIWTSTRGKCTEGHFMTVAGTSYNAKAVPLGVGAPACAGTAERKAVRCCGDAQIKAPTCAKSVTTCSELQWPVLSRGNGRQFCTRNDTLHTCAGNASRCNVYLARQCTAAEVVAAKAGNVSLPNTTTAFVAAGHAPTDQCLCCADVGVMAEPCSRPHKITVENSVQSYSFAVNTTETRTCQWVFDSGGCGPGGGWQMRWREAKVFGAVPGDGWRVYSASSPVDLVQVQNFRFPRDSILAEIQDHQVRRFRQDSQGHLMVPHGQGFAARTSYSDVIITSSMSAIVQMTATSNGVSLPSSHYPFAQFSVTYKCEPVSGGCLDSAASNFAANASFDDGSCTYVPCSCTCKSGFSCEQDECACVVTDSAATDAFYNASSFYRTTSANHVFHLAYEEAVKPYRSSICAATSNSSNFVDAINSGGSGGFFWFRFTAMATAATQINCQSATLIIEGVTSNDSALPEWRGGKIQATDGAEVFVRHVAFRNRISAANAAVAQVMSGSLLSMYNVLVEDSFAASFFGSVWCHTASSVLQQNTVCDFERVRFEGGSANENGAVGGWSSFQFRDVTFSGNWALRGGALFLNRVREQKPRSCQASNSCAQLEKCIRGYCEIQVKIVNCSFINNSAQGDWGGALAVGGSGFPVDVDIQHSVFIGNYANFGGSTIIVEGPVDLDQSREFSLADSHIVHSAVNPSSCLKFEDVHADWTLHTVTFNKFTATGPFKTVQNDTAAVDCARSAALPCSAGFGCSTKNASLHCEHCAANKVSNGRDACHICKKGEQAQVGHAGCELCLGNTVSEQGGKCVCPGVSTDFDKGSYDMVAQGRFDCLDSDGHQIVPQLGSSDECDDGVSVRNLTICCVGCPSGLGIAGQDERTCLDCKSGQPRIKPGVWRRSNASTRLFLCANPDACMSDGVHCADGYLDGSPLCSTCESGFAKDFSSNMCIRCPDSKAVDWLVGMAVLAIMVAALLFIVKKNHASIQPPTIDAILDGTKEDTKLVIVTIKIVLSFLQVQVFAAELDLSWPAWMVLFFKVESSISEPSASTAFAACLLTTQSTSSVVTSAIMWVLSPYIIFIVVVVVFAMHAAIASCKRKERQMLPKDDIIGAIICLIFVIYPSCAKNVMLLFSCVRLDEADTDAGLEPLHVLANHYVDCSEDPVVLGRVLAAITLIAVVVTIPGVMLQRLRHHSRLDDLGAIEVRKKFGFLYDGYERPFCWWELVVLVRKTSILCVQMVILSFGVQLQTITSLGILVCSLLLHISYRPYVFYQHDKLEMLSLVTSSCTFLAGLAFSVADNTTKHEGISPTVQTALGLLITAVNVAFLLYALYVVTGGVARKFVKCWQRSIRKARGRKLTQVHSAPGNDKPNMQRVESAQPALATGEEESQPEEVQASWSQLAEKEHKYLSATTRVTESKSKLTEISTFLPELKKDVEMDLLSGLERFQHFLDQGIEQCHALMVRNRAEFSMGAMHRIVAWKSQRSVSGVALEEDAQPPSNPPPEEVPAKTVATDEMYTSPVSA